jgi:hypothetical protein
MVFGWDVMGKASTFSLLFSSLLYFALGFGCFGCWLRDYLPGWRGCVHWRLFCFFHLSCQLIIVVGVIRR